MRKIKKAAAVTLTAAMALSMAACGSSNTSTTAAGGTADTSSTSADTTKDTTADTEKDTQGGGSEEGKTPRHEGSEPRTIKIGTWYDIYYDSTHTDVMDDPSYDETNEFSVTASNKELEKVRKIEEKYNVRLEYVNLTYEGITESINNSVLAGKPDCDIYMVNAELGIPAIANGYIAKLEDVLPATADVLSNQNYVEGVKLAGIDGTYLMLQKSGENVPAGTYPLAFNKQMLDDAGLEDPNALYARGEWTWDKWREYLLKLTKDNDGDGVTDVYGFGTRFDFLLDGLNFSNGTNMMNGTKENLSSKEVGETLDFINTMYNVDHVARPWNEEDFNDNQNAFQTGKVACWVTAQWIASGYVDWQGTHESSLGFDEIWCPWPVGPSGNKDTNPSKNQAGSNFYVLPTGVEDPNLVYSVFEDYTNWYDDDFSLRDYVGDWWRICADMKKFDEGSTANYDVTYNMGLHSTVDLWNGMNIDYQYPLLLKGEMTPAQFQETNKQLLQTAMDNVFK